MRSARSMLGAFCATLFAASAFCNVLTEHNVDGTAVSMLEHQLSGQGLRCGYSSADRSLVVIGCAEVEEQRPTISPSMFLARRNKMILAAELDARRNLIRALDTHLEMHDVSSLVMGDEDAKQVNESKFVLSAQKELRGCTVLRMCETCVNGVYQVCVAMKWSFRMSQVTMKSLSGAVPKKDRTISRDEWKRWASQADWSMVAGSRKFVDSDGVVRYVGIGCADVEGIEVSSLWMRRAQDSALCQARANLSLALYADTISEESAAHFYNELSGELGNSTDSFEAYVGRITRRSNKQTAFAPEVYATIVVHPITKRKMFVSVCGYEPWQLDKRSLSRLNQ